MKSTFECAVTVNGSRCEDKTPGDTTYLGGVTFCRKHQQSFEGLVDSGQLLREVNAAKLNRIFSGPVDAQASREALKSLRNKMAYVYFIRCGGYVKIGASRTPTARAHVIRTTGGVHAPFLLDLSSAELVATEPGGFKREKELHAQFKHLRHTGEWFTEARELARYISRKSKIPHPG